MYRRQRRLLLLICSVTCRLAASRCAGGDLIGGSGSCSGSFFFVSVSLLRFIVDPVSMLVRFGFRSIWFVFRLRQRMWLRIRLQPNPLCIARWHWQAAGGLEVVRGREQVGRSCGWGRFPCASLPTVLWCLAQAVGGAKLLRSAFRRAVGEVVLLFMLVKCLCLYLVLMHCLFFC